MADSWEGGRVSAGAGADRRAHVVVVPGLGLDARSVRRVLGRLAGSARVTVVRLPGMGLAAAVPPLAVLAEGVRDQLGEGPVVLVGHSQGCQVAAAAAGDPRVAALVLLGPSTDPRLRAAPVLAGRWLRTAVAEPWGQVPLILAQWARTGPRAMRALWRATSPDRLDHRLGGVRVPVTVVRGTRDRLCDEDWAAQVAGAAPAGRLVRIPGAAHMTPHTHPAAVAAVVRTQCGA